MKNNKITFSVFSLILGLILILVGTSYYRLAVYKPVDATSTKTTEFVIQKGEKGSSIGQRLADLELIRSPLFFRLFLRLRQAGGKTIQAGKYKLSPSMPMAQIVDEFQHGTFEIKLTFPEGLRIEEIVERITNNESRITKNEFLSAAKAGNFDYEFLRDAPKNATLEGFLFPDTYFVTVETSSNDLIEMMLENFKKKFDQRLQEDLKAQNLNIFETIILASIVEREAKFEKDRPMVAGILLKRLKNGWPLEADATVQYAKANAEYRIPNTECDWWPQELTDKDLQIDSPYNTRKYPALPPGPICNPGLSSIKAVVYPQESDYWYYVSDEKGNIYYSITHEEHLQKVTQYAR